MENKIVEKIVSPPPHNFEIILPPRVSQTNLVSKTEKQEPFRAMRLHFAINKNDLDQVKSLVEKKVDINFKVFNQTPLEVAIFQECFDIASYLIDNGALVDFKECSKFKSTPLHLSVKSNCVELVEKIVKLKPDLTNIKDSFGMSALHWAAFKDKVRVIEMLVAAGAKIDNVDNKGLTALHIAVIGNCHCSVKYLLSFGANVNLQDHEGSTALMKASSNFMYETIKLLLIQGQADPNIIDRNGLSCLHLVCKTGKHKNKKDIVILLLDHGADVDLWNKSIDNPLNLSLKLKDKLLRNLFMQAGAVPSEQFEVSTESFYMDISIPPSLKILCKKCIRKKLNRFIGDKINQLHLPPLLKNYLQINT